MMYHRESSYQTGSVTIRAATAEDEGAVRRLAQRDSRPVPEGELLIALSDCTPRAALSLASGEAIADPFHRTRELVRMLAIRRSEMLLETPPPSRLQRLLGGLGPRGAGAEVPPGAAVSPRSEPC